MSSQSRHEWLALNQQYLSAAIALVRTHLAAHVLRVTGGPLAESGLPAAEAAQQCAAIAKLALAPPALDTLCGVFGLSGFERDVLLLCAGMELDAAFGVSCAAAQGDPQKTYPTIGLALAALPQAYWNALLPNAPLRLWRLIEFAPSGGSPSAPLTTRPLRIDERILNYLAGVQHLDERLVAHVAPVFDESVLMPTHEKIVNRIVGVWSQPSRQLPVIALYGPDAVAGGRAIAAVAASSLGLDLYRLMPRVLVSNSSELHQFMRLWKRETLLSRNVLLLDCDESATEIHRESTITELIETIDAPLIAIGRERLHLTQRPVVAFEVRCPRPNEQRAAWLETLPDSAAKLNGQLDRLTAQFSLSWTQMQSAATQAQTSGVDSAFETLWDACRNQTRSQMEDLAQRIESVAEWEDLVLPETQKEILQDIVAQVQHRSTVYDAWGFAERNNRGLGISVLFAGASGTGKTMAAEVLAGALRLDLFRIDLSSVVSKYIGETEKNIRRVFDAAETGGAILLFDEADALFGKRSEVKDSHDRYANIEVSYLLQRMESYRGLAILTTNMKSALDTAFLRRLRFVVQFPFPDAPMRAQIWSRIFPLKTPTDGLDIERLSQLSVAGGNIKNMALTAAFLAADANEPIRMAHVLRAARSEYAKLEKPLTDAEMAGWVYAS